MLNYSKENEKSKKLINLNEVTAVANNGLSDDDMHGM